MACNWFLLYLDDLLSFHHIWLGYACAQVALDQAAFLLDLASIEGTWNDVTERISQCYTDAGVDDIAKFILYRDWYLISI